MARTQGELEIKPFQVGQGGFILVDGYTAGEVYTDANLKRIVTAVNNFEPMLEALKEVKGKLDTALLMAGLSDETRTKEASLIEEVIRQAEGGK